MTKRIEFHAPDGAVPEGAQPGEDFDLVCSFRVKGDGQICLVQLGDQQMPGYDSKEQSRPAYQAPEIDDQQ